MSRVTTIKMMAVSTAFLHLLLLCLPVSGADSKVSLSSDGGYGGIVVKVGREVPEEKCQDILQNLKVRGGNVNVGNWREFNH